MPPQITSRTIAVPFSGPGAGTAPLTWGQKAIMRDMEETGWSLNSSGAHNLPPGTTVEDTVAQLAGLMSRHPALRMRLGRDADGNLCQVVAESGVIDLEVIEVDDATEPADAAKYTDDLWYARIFEHFDQHTDWLMRTTVVRHRGETLYRVLTFDHLIVDGTAIGLILGELGVGPGSAPKPREDARTVQILDLARREQEPAARRTSDRAMAYWAARLADAPALTFGEPTHPEGRQGKRYWHGRFLSPATYLALLPIAKRTAMDTSSVLLAVIATSIARTIGVNPLTAKVIVGNRFRPGLAATIAPLSQNSVLTVDAADATLDEVVARARAASTAANMHAYYDPDQLDELAARLEAERGHPARVSCRINDRRVTTRAAVEEAAKTSTVTPEDIQAKLPETLLSWDGTIDFLPEQAFITVDDFPETVALQLIFDMACFTEEQIERMLRGIEEVAIEAAFDPGMRTGVVRG